MSQDFKPVKTMITLSPEVDKQLRHYMVDTNIKDKRRAVENILKEQLKNEE